MSDLDRILNSLIEEKLAPVLKELDELKAALSTLQDREYYSPAQVLNKYDISRTTLWRLQKENKLNKYVVKGKTFYKKNEVDELFIAV